MRLKAAVFLLVWALAFKSVAAQTFPRFASTSLCGDSYLLAIAPEQISALSWQSRDPLSKAPEAMRQLPQVWDDPEVLATVPADIILFGPGEGGKVDRILNRRGIERVDLVWGEDFATVMTNMANIKFGMFSIIVLNQP